MTSLKSFWNFEKRSSYQQWYQIPATQPVRSMSKRPPIYKYIEWYEFIAKGVMSYLMRLCDYKISKTVWTSINYYDFQHILTSTWNMLFSYLVQGNRNRGMVERKIHLSDGFFPVLSWVVQQGCVPLYGVSIDYLQCVPALPAVDNYQR